VDHRNYIHIAPDGNYLIKNRLLNNLVRDPLKRSAGGKIVKMVCRAPLPAGCRAYQKDQLRNPRSIPIDGAVGRGHDHQIDVIRVEVSWKAIDGGVHFA
jgi:hypothetical protein